MHVHRRDPNSNAHSRCSAGVSGLPEGVALVARGAAAQSAEPCVVCAESYGFTPYDLATLSGGHAFGLSASTNPQARPRTPQHVQAGCY